MNDLTQRHYTRQAPELINGRYSLTKSESDILFALLSSIDKDDEDFKDYTFTKSQLEAKLGIKIHTTQLRNTTRSLMRKVFEIYRNENDWELMGFSYFNYKNNVVTCRFDKAMKPYLLELKQYVLADVRQIMQIDSNYSRRIYLMLKERFKFGTRTLNIEELMNQLEVPKSYRRYADFKRKVLNQAVKDINAYTDIEVVNIGTQKKPIYFEEIKSLRKVEEVVFLIKKNQGDLKTFIDYIRELHANEALYQNREGRMLKCSKEGLLYYADNLDEHIDKTKAMKVWEWLHENREKLYVHQTNLLDSLN